MTARPRRVVLPQEEWRQLGFRRRREVARCARRGRSHPDPYVAAVARAWAAAYAAPEPSGHVTARRVAGSVGWLGLIAVAGSLVGDASYLLLPAGSDWRERRLARRILAARSQPCER